MTRSTLALAFLSFAAVPFCACVASDTPPQVQTYREVDGQTLAAHVFAPADNDGETARPAILLFHGGGWSVSSPTWTFSAARRFAGHGMVAIAVQYRLADDQTTPIDALADVCAAFRWARSQATSLNLDTDRVVGYGVSAGGHLVSSTVTVGCPAVWEGAPAAEPNALLLWSPALDMARDGWFERKLLGRVPALDYSPRGRSRRAERRWPERRHSANACANTTPAAISTSTRASATCSRATSNNRSATSIRTPKR